MLIGILLILYGACAAFFGYHMYRITIFFQGFIVGAVLGGMLGNGIILTLLFGFFFGIVLGILAVVMLRLGVFLQCFVCAFLVTFLPMLIQKIIGLMNWQTILTLVREYLLTGEIGIDFTTDIIIGVAVGVVIGVLGLIFSRIVITVLSALAGGALAGVGVMSILKGTIPQIAIVLGVLLAIVGMIYQYRDGKREKASHQKVQQPVQISQGICYCSECGTRITDTTKFCPNCGTPQQSADTRVGGF